METEYIPASETLNYILCCSCGCSILPNPSNTCANCLRNSVDITEGIPKSCTLENCRNCERYLSPPTSWVSAALESKELMAICLKKLKSHFTKVRLINASFIWTEPHSKRIKVKLSVQKQIQSGTFLQQDFIVEFVVHNQMCMDCHRVEAKDFWKAAVQVRQKVTRKRTFYYLEQVLLKSKMHESTTKISQQPNGLDFFFANDQEARKMKDFLQKKLPCVYKKSQKLISHDVHNSTYNYKFTYSVELPGVCKDDIVCLPRKLAQQLGNLGQIVICLRVTNHVHLIDIDTLQIAKVSGPQYWQQPFYAVCETKSLSHYTVMSCEEVDDRRHKAGEGSRSTRHKLARVDVIKTCELGMHYNFINCITHLGHLLNFGDSVLGLDLKNSNVNNDEISKIPEHQLPDVILVKKVYDKQVRKRNRKWTLKRMMNDDVRSTTTDGGDGYNQFLEDLEEDQELRQNIDIYIDGAAAAQQENNREDGMEETPQISLAEMITTMNITDVEMEDA